MLAFTLATGALAACDDASAPSTPNAHIEATPEATATAGVWGLVSGIVAYAPTAATTSAGRKGFSMMASAPQASISSA